MNKKVSKTLAAVLSAAMAASAFAMSTSASFAAGTTATFTVKDATLNLTSATGTINMESTVLGQNGSWMDYVTATKDGQTVPVNGISPIEGEDWQSSNTNIATIDENGNVTVDGDRVNERQEVVFTKKFNVTIASGALEDGSHTTPSSVITATATIRVVTAIYPDGSLLVLPAGDYTATSDVSANKEVSINESADFDVFKVGTTGNVATFTAQNDADYKYSVSGNLATTERNGVIDPQDPYNVKTGTATVSAVPVDENGDTEIKAASLTVDDSYLYESNDDIAVDTTYGQETATTMTDANNMNRVYNVTGMDIVATDDLTLSGNEKDAVLGNITSKSSDITVRAGTVGDITTGGAVAVGVAHTSDDQSATVGNIDAGTVTIEGSKKAEGPSVEVGNVTADGDVTVTAYDATSNGQQVGGGDVTVGDITTEEGTITLTAGTKINTMTVGDLSGTQGYYENCPYVAKLDITAGTFNLNDLLYFGEIAIDKDANVTAGAIDTGMAGEPDDETLPDVKSTMTVNGRLTADSIKTTQFVRADGTVIVPVDSVEVTGTNSANTGVTLLVEDAEVGDVLYTSAAKNDNLFILPGVTAVEGTNTGKNVYTYSVASLAFRGVMMDQTGTVEVGSAGTTLTLSKVPSTADLPEGVTFKWEASKDSVELTPSADGLSCTVTPTGYTDNNLNGSNDVTVTATVYKDDKPYTDLETQYAAASVDLTLTNAAPEAPTNPFTVVVTNAEGEKITCAADGSTVIEVPQSMAFNFDISSKDEVKNFDYTVGNGSVGGTNTIQPDGAWNGTKGQYQIYAAGAVGSETGAYINGIKIFTLKVTDRPFTSDTTLNMDLKVGQKYQFEITLDDPTADFTFKTADGQALSTSYDVNTYPAENGKYYCSVTAQQAGRDIGVYCEINGKTYKIFTAHTIA